MSGFKRSGAALEPGHGGLRGLDPNAPTLGSIVPGALHGILEVAVRLDVARAKGEQLMVTRMCQRFDGSGVVKIQCSEGTFAKLKLDNMPVPRDWGTVINGRRIVPMDTRGMGVDGDRFRILWPELANGPGSKNKSSSFTLSGDYVNETLYVFTEFLRDQGVEFLKLANKHGSGFRDVRLSGTDLAYLTGDIPHSPACHVDFTTADSPEVGGPTGREIGHSALDCESN